MSLNRSSIEGKFKSSNLCQNSYVRRGEDPAEGVRILKHLKAGFFLQVPNPWMRRLWSFYGEVLVPQKVLLPLTIEIGVSILK